MSRIRCEKCDQYDSRASFKSGKHDCISLLKDAINQIQTTSRSSGKIDDLQRQI